MIDIPEHYIELEHIYNATLARGIKSLAVVSTSPGEGVSSVIIGLAKRNALAARTTLVVDLNIYNPDLSRLSKPNAIEHSSKVLPLPTTLQHGNINDKIAVITVPVERKLVLGLREPGVLQTHIEQWLKDYDNVLIDTSPMSLNNGANLPPEYISSACDGTLLTVLAGKTTNTALSNTLKKLNNSKSLLIGIVVNDQFNPSLQNELLREVQRLDSCFPKLASKLRYWIKSNKILSLEI
ncbi:MAG: protein SypD [Gammaproteobacteria bacterium]|nr:protein SypD [Gammaproteobacteria bacterium]